MKISDWFVVEDTCACRVVLDEHGKFDPNNVSTRVAFIEKTPRVKTSGSNVYIPKKSIDFSDEVWIYGDKGSNGFDEESRDWCDKMLDLLY